MRVLTVRQPWAWAIIHGGKDVENRTRSLGPYRGPVAIHVSLRPMPAGGAWDVAAAAGMDTDRLDGDALNLGHIIGVVDLVGTHRGAAPQGCPSARTPGPWLCSPWADDDKHHLVLANPRALDDPLPWVGGLGLRKSGLFVSGDWLGQYIDPGHSSCTPYGCPPSCSSEPIARLEATS